MGQFKHVLLCATVFVFGISGLFYSTNAEPIVAPFAIQTLSVSKQDVQSFSPDEFTGITYEIHSTEDWNNLLNGITDAANWQSGGVYTGTENVLIKIDGSVSSDVATISTTQLGSASEGKIIIYSDDNTVVLPNLTVNGPSDSNAVGVDYEIYTIGMDVLSVGSTVRNLVFENTLMSNHGIDVSACFDSDHSYIGKLNDIALMNLSMIDLSNVHATGSVSICRSDDAETIDGAGTLDTLINLDSFWANSVSIDGWKIKNVKTAMNLCHMSAPKISVVNCIIDGSENGISANYTSGFQIINNVHMTNVKNGFVADFSNLELKMSDCSFEGDDSVDSVGLTLYSTSNTSMSMDTFLNQDGASIKNCEVSHFNTGVCGTGNRVYMDSVQMHDVNNGFYATSSGSLWAKDCSFVANESIDATYSDDSYGVLTKRQSVSLINTDILGFKDGVRSGVEFSYLIGCNIDSVCTNAVVSYAHLVNCRLSGASECALADGNSYNSRIEAVNCELTGLNAAGSKGIGKVVGESGIIYLSSMAEDEMNEEWDTTSGGSSNLRLMWTYFKNHCPDDIIEQSVISNYENGVWFDSTITLSLYNVKIKDCDEYGIYMDNSGYCYLNNVEISDVKNGWYSNRAAISTHNVVSIHDCDEYGFYKPDIATWLTASWQKNHTDNYLNEYMDVYNCENGIYLKYNSGNTNVRLHTHNNHNDGLQLPADAQILVGDVESYDNGGYNVNMLGPVTSFHPAQGPSRFTNNTETGKNMNVNLKCGTATSYDTFFYTGHTLTCDNSEIFINNGSRLVLSPSSSVHPWLVGTMTFSVPDESYVEDMDVVEISKGCLLNDGVDEDVYVRTHFFASKEGWMIHATEPDTYMFGSGNTRYLSLTEGCEVVYDYATNGGTSWSGDFDKITYEKGSNIDLSYTATKPGYEFIGWSLNPDDTEVVDSVTAGTKNITLYAVYRKSVAINYHTWNAIYDSSEDGYLFNEDSVVYADENGTQMLKFESLKNDGNYERIGYASGMNTDIFDKAGDLIDYLPVEDVINIYCVYSLKGELTYQVNGKVVQTTVCQMNKIATDVVDANYEYMLIDFVPEKGYRFVGWRNEADQLFIAGSVYKTTEQNVVMTADLEPIAVESLLVNPKEANLIVGDNIQLSVTIRPDDAINSEVEWISENPEIAKVGNNGLVKAKAVGTVKVYARLKDNPQISDYAVIIVTEKKHEDVTTTEEEVTTTEASSASTSDATTESSTDASTEATTETVIDHPITGDTVKIGFATIVLLIAGAGAIVLARKRK